MNPSTATTVNFGEFLANARRHIRLWCAPAVAFLIVGFGYCLLRQPTWKVTQALIVREEASGGLSRQGRFDNVEALKTALEMVQEVARSRAVVASALAEIGPESGKPSPSWPTARDVARVQGAISVKAPKGVEFGKSDVIHLITSAGNSERAMRLNRAVCLHLRKRFQELREAKAVSIIHELEQAVKLAETELNAVTQRIEGIESDVGVDLGELRTLNELGAGESNLRSASTQIKNELRQARTNHDANQQILEELQAAQRETSKVTALSNRLLQSQPSLRRLKDGLIDAQLRKAEVLGKMSASHPLAAAAVANEEAVRRDLRAELHTAEDGLTAEMKVSAALITSLQEQLSEVDERLEKLASIRARYANVADDVRQRSQILEKAGKDLADARATVAAAQAATLITLLDTPEAGERPVGPSAKTILAASGAAGLAAGFGLLFLLHPVGASDRRRWGDIAAMGRRASDFIRNRRGGDQASCQNQPASGGGRGRRAEDAIPPPQPPAADDGASVDRRRGDRRR